MLNMDNSKKYLSQHEAFLLGVTHIATSVTIAISTDTVHFTDPDYAIC
jgi:hypothetical protein